VVIDQRVVLVFVRNLVLYVAAWPDPLHEVEQNIVMKCEVYLIGQSSM